MKFAVPLTVTGEERETPLPMLMVRLFKMVVEVGISFPEVRAVALSL